MAKKYIFQRVRVATDSNIKMKTELMNKTLQNLGVKERVRKIDVLDILSHQPLYLTDGEIAGLAKRIKTRRIKVC